MSAINLVNISYTEVEHQGPLRPIKRRFKKISVHDELTQVKQMKFWHFWWGQRGQLAEKSKFFIRVEQKFYFLLLEISNMPSFETFK